MNQAEYLAKAMELVTDSVKPPPVTSHVSVPRVWLERMDKWLAEFLAAFERHEIADDPELSDAAVLKWDCADFLRTKEQLDVPEQ